MTPTVTIRHATGSYPVFVGRGLLSRLGELVNPRGAVFLVTSASLADLFAERVLASFSRPPRLVHIPEGERFKTLATVESLVTELLENGARRDSTILAVGGGVIGDTAGFAASILLRGVELVQVPTTLLAQADSAIGGKVGVNHAFGKNLIGSFHQPHAVVTDPVVLDSLPQHDFVSGAFEVLKGGVVADPDLFGMIEERPGDVLARVPSVVDEMIRRKISIKAAIVSADEREGGLRRLLNYGHTIGHGIESAAHYDGIAHGEAVAWGMIGANAVAIRRGLFSKQEAARVEQVVRALQPASAELSRDEILVAAGHDKKNRSGVRVMVLPRRIGECVVVEDVTDAEISYGVDAALEAMRSISSDA